MLMAALALDGEAEVDEVAGPGSVVVTGGRVDDVLSVRANGENGLPGDAGDLGAVAVVALVVVVVGGFAVVVVGFVVVAVGLVVGARVAVLGTDSERCSGEVKGSSEVSRGSVRRALVAVGVVVALVDMVAVVAAVDVVPACAASSGVNLAMSASIWARYWRSSSKRGSDGDGAAAAAGEGIATDDVNPCGRLDKGMKLGGNWALGRGNCALEGGKYALGGKPANGDCGG